ncbi:MAG: sulfurtransferase [Candidatus Tectomicrobia bacterium]|nr:sulfurtransferase [Candidatus Tectomicrobia bacterium]
MTRRRGTQKGWILALSLLAIIGWTGLAAAAEYARPELFITTDELAGLPGKPETKILDVRGTEAYKAGHIPGALSLPRQHTQYRERGVPDLMAPVENLEESLGKLGIRPTDTLVLYDETASLEVARVFWTADVLGHAKVRILNGGMSKWAKERRPISKDTPAVTSASYKAKPDWTKFADAAYVMANLKNPKAAIVDSRTSREWSGQVASMAVRSAGRIPGATNLDSDLTLTSEGGTKLLTSAGELAKLLEGAGAKKDKEIIVYRRTGVRASANYLALKLLGYPKVRVYDASMIDWGNRPELPIEKSAKN